MLVRVLIASEPILRGATLKTLAELQLLCQERGISVDAARRGKEPYIEALRNHFWQQEFGDQRLPSQITPMLLSDWSEQVDLAELQRDDSNWIVQPKLDGVRVLMHISKDGIRVTGRNTSEATFRLTEHQGNLSHLFAGVTDFEGTILDGELICPTDVIDTEETRTTSALQAAIAILAAAPDKAKRVQDAEQCHLQFHCFDILSCLGEDVALWSLRDRIDLLGKVLADINNPHVFRVPTIYTEKQKFHDETLLNGGEGTVWKLLDETYEPGRRVTHWLKRKRCLEFARLRQRLQTWQCERGKPRFDRSTRIQHSTRRWFFEADCMG